MSSAIRMVFLDIDGTLVHRGRLVASAAEAVQQLHNRGVEVALCTGRSRLHTEPVREMLGVTQCVYFNGGLVERNGDWLAGKPLEAAVVQRMSDFFQAEHIPLILHTHTSAVSLNPLPASLRSILNHYDFPEVALIAPDQHHEVTAMTYQANMFCTKDWDTVVQNLLPECLLYRWEEGGADLQRRGCDKAEGAAVLLQHLGIDPNQAMHIGDGGNDIGMFQKMGMSVAMGNAMDEVKQHAKMVTQAVEDDGVLVALRQLQLI